METNKQETEKKRSKREKTTKEKQQQNVREKQHQNVNRGGTSRTQEPLTKLSYKLECLTKSGDLRSLGFA